MITFDIETLSTNDQEVIESLKATITAPGQYKKPESIAEWLAANLESELKDKVAKTSFDGLYGRIACIAWSDGNGVFASDETQSEREVIELFYAFIENNKRTANKFCGHNLAGFDLPFLKHRSIILGIRPPDEIMQAMTAKPWDSCIADTMLMWSSDSQKRTSMDKLCKAFGIVGKDGFDGSQVAETWPKDPRKVIEYCKDDVRRTELIHNRITFAG
jgi:predicted PolB exonuclease-like 3'-5' exonuclease